MIKISKIKLSEDDFVYVGMNYNYYMIPRLAYAIDNLKKLKQQILDNQEMAAELRTIRNNEIHDIFLDKVLQIMKKYFGKRQNNDNLTHANDFPFTLCWSLFLQPCLLVYLMAFAVRRFSLAVFLM